ncbi:MAG: methylated-DNA--[protein]-cysteine S-methyltransferase [Lentisphaerae bacterium]|nr:methylated-DNA--[protein]-cysteine S-methyltransferase [Lentisphaerota bacterium]MCP4103261.1 methylated-DNA--[protein]-cysteine S-methyltransferase [Lentisphaerota bacterium]
MKYYTRFNTRFCEIILVGDENGLTNLHLNTGEGKRHFEISEKWVRNDSFFTDIVKQVKEYFDGKRKSFEVSLAPEGTDFQKSVWNALSKIPYGEVHTYKDIAVSLGNKNACRAVGMANSKNPIPLIIPCHRVIGASGKLIGFAHGLKIKKQLINLERKVHG